MTVDSVTELEVGMVLVMMGSFLEKLNMRDELLKSNDWETFVMYVCTCTSSRHIQGVFLSMRDVMPLVIT